MGDYKLLIKGKLVSGDEAMTVINPATEEAIVECPKASEAQLNVAVAAAKEAFPAWSATSIEERKKVIGAIADVIEANATELAQLLTQEQGKPLADATGEVFGTAACNLAAGLAGGMPICGAMARMNLIACIRTMHQAQGS